jgi:deoxyribodipyrimidine photo-lyase
MSQTDLFTFETALPPSPDRASGLARLSQFTPLMGRAYASRRNYDLGPNDRSNISCLSAHVRHRLVLESELVRAALSAHSLQAAEKFIQEVCWRTYWKGWLELRPAVWSDYKAELEQVRALMARDGGLSKRYQAAIEGRTGIEGFDAWAAELIETGYLHNHARMWFASIWIFTLNLPWVLGADHFLRHLVDGDAASNTLSWRWVGGLQTVGKTYLARASNLETYTEGRFAPDPASLASDAPPLSAFAHPPAPGRILAGDGPDRSVPAALWLHEEDLHPESWALADLDINCVVYDPEPVRRGSGPLGLRASDFTRRALAESAERAAAHWGVEAIACEDADALVAAAQESGARQLVTQRPCQGPVREAFGPVLTKARTREIPVIEMTRDWDQAFHPHATKGFFKFKSAIPDVLGRLGLT